MNTESNAVRDDFADYGPNEGSSRGFSEQLDLQHYLRILRKHKWPIVLFTAGITALAGFYAYTATPIYQATSTLLIEQQKANVVSIEELYGVDSDNTDYYQTQFELLKSRSLAEKVVEEMNLWNDPELSPAASAAAAAAAQASGSASNSESGFLDSILQMFDTPAPGAVNAGAEALSDRGLVSSSQSGGLQMPIDNGSPSAYVDPTSDLTQDQMAVVGNFMARLSVDPVRKTKLVKLSFESRDPAKAARIANYIGEAYINDYLESKMELTTKASLWLNERLTSLRITLDESANELIRFKQENGLVDVDGSVGRLNEQELLLLTSELADARSELSDASDVFREVQSLRAEPELLVTVPGVQSDALIQRLQIEQGQAQRQLDELLNRYGELHPRVVDAKSQLTTIDSSVQKAAARVVAAIEQDYRLLQQRVASIEAKLSAGKTEIQAIGTKKFELDALERVVDTNQNIYDTFFNRMSEARSADGLETANARISDLASVPTFAVKPKKQLIIALAALASLVLSALMAFLYEQMDNTIKSTDDIQKKLGMTLLGILPLLKTGILNRKQELPLNPMDIVDKKNTFHEAVNTARTALSIGDVLSPKKVIMVTSSVPGEGKSTAAINLAYSFGQLERVLLIDCDLRRPTIAKAAGLDKNVAGLANLITKTAPASECIKRGAIGENVDILPSGPIPHQPLELLSSMRFEKLIEQLRKHYDRIIIDSAPTQAVSDALVLSRIADSLVYAVKSHDTSFELVKRGLQRLEQAGAPIAGVLMTQVDVDRLASYGGDYYYQGYYDYYGYKDNSESSQKNKLRLTQEDLRDLKRDDSDFEIDLGFSRPDLSVEHNDFDMTMEITPDRGNRRGRPTVKHETF
ncbi:MAG: GumC family protein [Granulosicoccus sp.]